MKQKQQLESWRSWLALVVIILVSLSTIGVHSGGIGVFTAYFNNEFNSKLVDTSWIASVFIGFNLFGSPFASALMRHIGSRYSICLAAVCCVVGVVFTAFSTQVWHAVIAYGIVVGLGTSMVNMSCISAITHMFDKHRHLAYNSLILGRHVGILSFPFISEKIFSVLSYRYSMLTMAAIMSLAFIAGPVFYSKAEEESVRLSDNTAQKGKSIETLPEAEEGSSHSQIHLADSVSAVGYFAGVKVILLEHVAVLKKPVMIAFYISVILETVGYSMPFVILRSSIKAKLPYDEITPDLTYTIIGIVAVSITMCMVLANIKWSPNHLCIFMMGPAGMGSSLLAIGLVQPAPTNFLLCSGVFGLSSGVIVTIFPSVIHHLNGEEHHREAVAISFFVAGIGASAGPAIGAQLQDLHGIDSAFFFGATCSLLSSFVMLTTLLLKPSIWRAKPITRRNAQSSKQSEELKVSDLN